MHGWRLYALTLELARRASLDVDREVLLVAALLHDIGLYPDASKKGVYTADGAVFARELLAGREDWPAVRLDLLADAIERHHELRRQWDRGDEVELVRRADLIEVSAGPIRFGVSRDFFKQQLEEYPRSGFYREVGRLLGHALVERPLTIPRIFLR